MQISLKRIVQRVRRFILRLGRVRPDDDKWWRDPLSHPDIQAMSERQRADLPFDPHKIRPD